MINYLNGQLISKVKDSPTGCSLTVEVNNIGYFILTNKRVVALLPQEGEEVTIYTSLIHREDAMHLCGFNTREDRDLFNLLTTVSGIGMKAALTIMGELGAYNLVDAVLSDNDKAISKAKGVGPKLAKKVILELKEKMTKWRDKVAFEASGNEIPEDIEKTESYLEAETVLLSLGYSKKEVEESINNSLSLVTNKNDSEEILRASLQRLTEE